MKKRRLVLLRSTRPSPVIKLFSVKTKNGIRKLKVPIEIRISDVYGDVIQFEIRRGYTGHRFIISEGGTLLEFPGSGIQPIFPNERYYKERKW